MFYRRLFDIPSWRLRHPFHDLDLLRRQMDQVFETLSRGHFEKPTAGVFPLTNVTEDSQNYYVRTELPGIRNEELDLQVTANSIAIAGERKIPAEGNDVKYHRRERSAGKFSRLIGLPGDIDVDKVQAALTNGILTVTIPKAQAAKPRQIAVK